MSENIKSWLIQMLDYELEETEVAIDNESLWTLGSNDEDEAAQHEENMAELEEYKQVLTELKARIESGEMSVEELLEARAQVEKGE